MTELLDTSPATAAKAPQISEMFQKFALAFKTKTFEFFADDDENTATSAADYDGFSLLDSAEDFITDQKVIILKPDQPDRPDQPDQPINQTQELPPKSTVTKPKQTVKLKPLNTQLAQTLISSTFATVSSFEASYLQLQTAHVPLNEEGVRIADEALVSHLQRLSDLKQLHWDLCRNPEFGADLNIGSCLEAQVQENQSKLRVLGTVSDHLQEEIDRKDNQVLELRKKLGEIQRSNAKLSKRLSGNLNFNVSLKSSVCDVLLSVRVFDSVLTDACRATHKFTKILIDLMMKARWDLDLAANSVHSDVRYAKTGHNRYALYSYVCLGMFHGFDLEGFGLELEKVTGEINSSLKLLLEHVSSNPLELISRNPSCEFAKFCEKKYQELVHPTMESSIFCNLDHNEAVLNSWRSLSVFYESFVNMASSIWALHKLAFSFDPVVEIFQVERGVDFSMVYMEDVTRRCTFPGKTRMKVGFTVVPGFKIGRTVMQSQVYLCNSDFTS
ncbi:protein GRAVITROPIC IN THE LIGHT 1 isoform X1 [Mercurialis annua]|uniref:protein GRAVITROPIC IN THE LIGHT 1 isoform X1 n=1 Tax=Mercurialis annua TaxID=3986 RepID=UPI00215DF906|nr:protein GRAVITROPIC IN THE LIGHT 1 isoform X1 [Mercurialis annua]